jgi:hypothetical protein
LRAQGRVPAEYSKQLRRKFGLWPTWLPNSSIEVGDFGRIRGGVFAPEGRLEQFGIAVDPTAPRPFSDQLFASRGVRHALLGGSGKNGLGGAGARIEFSRAFGVFVGLRDCGEERLEDPLDTAARLSELREMGRWRDDYCLVTSVVNARAALIAVGSAPGGALELSGEAPAPDILTWLGAEVRIANETSVAYRALLGAGCSPLFRLSKLVAGPELVPRGRPLATPQLAEVDPLASEPLEHED